VAPGCSCYERRAQRSMYPWVLHCDPSILIAAHPHRSRHTSFLDAGFLKRNERK